MAELPSGTVTFLFTDLEGSTRLWEEHREAMQEALARHDEILRNGVAAHGGHVVKTTGDGVHAVFAAAHDALDAAMAMQRALAAEPFAETGPLRVRMAVHTCEAEYRDGDYYGSEVNRAARLMSIAHGGQILCSGATQRLVVDAPLRDLGEHRLRDLERAEQVFQVLGESLPAQFPPLRALDARTTNLPVQLTSFVGRARELAELMELLRVRRLVTITGVGGVGKTRLAMQLGAELAPGFSGGVWLCELAAVEEDHALIEVVAMSLGVSAQQGVSLRDSVLAFLRTKHMLLILDNCEHLLRAVGHLADDVLEAAAEVTVLATSREGLGVPGEHLWPLRSLDVGDEATDRGSDTEAVALFADRARAVVPSFVVDAAVGEICRRLDGLPLAIELAAARVGAMAPAEIEGLLDERFRLLTGGSRRAVDRHHTLRGAIDWSYALLDGRERAVFERLAVFAGGFDAAAARAVAAGDDLDPFDVVDALGELVAKSMLSVDRSDPERTRYEMLETLRQYALERLETLDADTWRRRHAAYFASYAAELGRDLVSSSEISARRRVVLDFDNLRSAMGWALERDDPGDRLLGVQIVGSLAGLGGGMRASGFGAWAERAVPAARGAPAGLRFAVLGAAAFAATVRGDHDTARAWCDEAFALDDIADCPYRLASYSTRAMILYGDLPAATEFLIQSAVELDAVGDSFGAVSVRSLAGMFAWLSGDTVAALRHTEQSLAGARPLGNPTALTIALLGWATTRLRDDPQAARAAFEEGVAWVEAGASDVVYPDLLEQLGRLECAMGDGERALQTITRSLRVSTSASYRPSVLGSLFYLAEALGLLGRDPDVAAVVHGFATNGPDAALVPSVQGREAELHDQALAAVKAALGERRFAELTERGAAMSFDAAVDYTMAELDRILSGLDDA